MGESRQARIEETRREVGWAYDEMRWLSEEEAREAERERRELLARLDGWVSIGFAGTKLHAGPLSPGCRICGEGAWGCHFVTRRCNTHCFYCPDSASMHAARPAASEAPAPVAQVLQARDAPHTGCSARSDDVPQTAGWVLRTPEEHVRFIAAFGIRGVGFTGGEPLLLQDTVLAHLQAIRQAFGSSVYLWLYTNGILADDPTLVRLRGAGLDEIRFDIAASGYDLAPVARAVRHVPTVTIEIPVIPQDFEVVARLLPEIERIGVAHLNLHQLIAGPHNYTALQRLGCHFLHQPLVPVMESEPCALRLLLSARERGLSLPINYCCSAYKSRFQPRGDRLQAAKIARRAHEEVTATGYLRSFVVSGPPDSIPTTIARFRDAGFPPELWALDAGRAQVIIHSRLLPYVDWESTRVEIRYSEPRLRPKDPAAEFSEQNLVNASAVVCQQGGWDRMTFDRWRQRIGSEAGPAPALARWEELEAGLPEIC
jgi:pyruvate formate-lyase activating enzyme-like uncharacterized protein